MTSRGPFLFLVALLFIAGAGIAAYRQAELGVPLLPGALQDVWQVEARIEFVATGVPAHVYLTVPPDQSGFRSLGTSHTAAGFGFDQAERLGRAHWTSSQVQGEQRLFYTLELIRDDDYAVPETVPSRPSPVILDEPYHTAASTLLDRLQPLSADAHSLTQQIIRAINTIPRDQSLDVLLERYTAQELLAQLMSMSGSPAREVQVLRLEDGRRRQNLEPHVQVWQGDRWQLYDTASGPLYDRKDLLLWQTETPSVLEVVGGARSRVTFSMISQTRSTLALATQQSDPFNLSLYSLPIAEQGMFKLIMLLPVGAFVVVFMRLLVGVRTSGTFMPVLIALAFLQTELLPGVASLLLVVAIGLLLRSYLSALNLLLVARIATLVIIVIGIISVFSVISFRLGLIGGLTITFFPMIILAWTIERMSIIWEEEGPREVLIQGGGSLLVAILAYLLMNLDIVRHLAFNFPELHLCVLATIMLLGRYTGYRLLELHRFAAIGRAPD